MLSSMRAPLGYCWRYFRSNTSERRGSCRSRNARVASSTSSASGGLGFCCAVAAVFDDARMVANHERGNLVKPGRQIVAVERRQLAAHHEEDLLGDVLDVCFWAAERAHPAEHVGE